MQKKIKSIGHKFDHIKDKKTKEAEKVYEKISEYFQKNPLLYDCLKNLDTIQQINDFLKWKSFN